ncbi:uncharacterized protein LOC113906240 [Bos indicus x Bos taurus]|uniref:uncharacterized protein LOC113906240 n=1 Tax=Bos indicus x Bos taurus TaxID=30522 RepID=UPI000F7D47CE|nr:uncharacterized protein LOC113906240 [Bos indicus x Bos taurus]
MHFGRAPWNGRPRRPTAIPPPAQTPRPTLPRSYRRSGRRESFIFPASPFTWPRRPGTLGQSLHPSPEEGRGGSGGFRGAGGQAGSGEASKRQREPRSTTAASAAAKLPPLPRLSGQAGGREGRLPAPAPVAPAAQPFGGPARELVWPPPAAQLAGGRDPAGRCPLSRAPRNRRPRPQLPRLRGRGAPRWEGGCFGAGRRTCAAGGAGPAWGERRESLPGRHGNGAAISNPRVVPVARCQGARRGARGQEARVTGGPPPARRASPRALPGVEPRGPGRSRLHVQPPPPPSPNKAGPSQARFLRAPLHSTDPLISFHSHRHL